MLDDVHVERYDVVVLSAVVNDALHLAPYRRWVARVRSTLETTRRRGPALVVWLGAPPIRSIPLYDSRLGQIAEEHAEWLNAGALGVCREVGAVYVALSAPPIKDATRHRSPADYLLWGRQIVDALAPSIEERLPQPTSSTHNGADGGDRVDAIRRLRLTEHANDSRLERLVGTAKRTLGTGSAMFTLLDDEKEWPLAWVGRGFAEIPIDQSACIHTIAAPDGMYVANAADDERFASAALVTGPAGLRYYAGYPVEAPDGTRIGALCVFDRTPRDADQGEADLEVLRELALLAQRELWRWEPER
jgi:GAF domain-containing protein